MPPDPAGSSICVVGTGEENGKGEAAVETGPVAAVAGVSVAAMVDAAVGSTVERGTSGGSAVAAVEVAVVSTTGLVGGSARATSAGGALVGSDGGCVGAGTVGNGLGIRVGTVCRSGFCPGAAHKTGCTANTVISTSAAISTSQNVLPHHCLP
jgi:hypothetical protein